PQQLGHGGPVSRPDALAVQNLGRDARAMDELMAVLIGYLRLAVGRLHGHRRNLLPTTSCRAWGGTPRSLERGVLVVGGAGDLVVLAGDAEAAGCPLDALRVGGHLLLHVLREDTDELERGLRVGDAAAGLLPLKPDASDDLMRPQALRKDPLSKVVRPVANRRWRQR